MIERAVIHLNVADFAVAVERVIDQRLRGQAVLIAAEGAARAVVYDMSEEAYAEGVRKGMPLPRAQRLCRRSIVLPPHPDRYERAMNDFLKRALPYSPQIEMTDACGHLFIEATGSERLWGPAYDVAWRIRRTVKKELGLDPIWSVAPNKLVAKVASRVVKPQGEYIIADGEQEQFLRPLPLLLLPGLELDDLRHLAQFRLRRVEHLLAWSTAQLEIAFGRRAALFYETARGIDHSPVLTVGELPPRAQADYEFGDDTNDTTLVEAALFSLAERVGADLRKRRFGARRFGVYLDYSDGQRLVRQATCPSATANDFTIFELAKLALSRAWTRRVRLRHLRLAADRLAFPPAQLSLFEEKIEEKIEEESLKIDQAPQVRLVAALDQIRARFGQESIIVGRHCHLPCHLPAA